MIIYGFMNYALWSKKGTPLSRDWRGARSTMNIHIGAKKGGPEMIKYNHDTNYADLNCVRYAEHILGLSPNSIKWPTVSPAVYKHLESTESGVFDPSYAPGKVKDVGIAVPPFNNRHARLLAIDLTELANGLQLHDISQNKNHKAYVLLLVAAFISLGNRLFFEACRDPESVPDDYDEVKLFRLIMRTTKLVMTGNPSTSSATNKIGGRYVNAKVLDFTPILINSYHNLVQTHPNLHLDDVHKLSQATDRFVKSTRLVTV